VSSAVMTILALPPGRPGVILEDDSPIVLEDDE
jgi:hypothetical protein